MPYSSPLNKIDECVCGERLSTKQKHCPRCKEPNPDYRPRTWTGGMAGIEEDEKKEEDTGPPVDKDSVEYV